MSDTQDLTSRLNSLILLVVKQYPDPEFDKAPEKRTWVRALANECFNLGVAMTRDEADAIQRRHKDNMDMYAQSIAVTAQANAVAAELNARSEARQIKRDEKWEELCTAQNETMGEIRAVLTDMFELQLKRGA